MGLEELVILAAGCWLAESRTKGETRRMDWESAAGFLREVLDLVWHLVILAGLSWAVQALSLGLLPQARFAGLGLTLVCAYGLSLLRRRPDGAAEPYFLALASLALTVQASQVVSGSQGEVLRLLPRLLGGSVGCAAILLGLKERLRWAPVLPAAEGLPIVLLCLALLAVIRHSLGF